MSGPKPSNTTTSSNIIINIDESSKARTEAETVRLISGWLQDHGYVHSCQALLDEAGMVTKDSYQLRKAVRTINRHIEEGSWDSVFHSISKCKPLSANKSVHFALLRQQFLECVDSGDQQKALMHLTKKIKPLEHEIARSEFHVLSYTLTCKSVSESPDFQGWTVTKGRRNLQAYLQHLCAPDSTGPVGHPYIHDHGVSPISGALDDMLLDAVAYRHHRQQKFVATHPQTGISDATNLMQTPPRGVSEATTTPSKTSTNERSTNNTTSSSDDICRISVHSLLPSDDISKDGGLSGFRPCAKFTIQHECCGGGDGDHTTNNASFVSAGNTPSKGPLPRPLLLQPSMATSTGHQTPRKTTPGTITAIGGGETMPLFPPSNPGAQRALPRSCCVLPREQLIIIGCSDGSLVSYPLSLTNKPEAEKPLPTAATACGDSELNSISSRPDLQQQQQHGVILSKQHNSRVWAMSSAKTTQRFVSIGSNTMLAWSVVPTSSGDTPLINPIGEARHSHELLACVIAKDGSFAVTGSKAGDITFWDLGAAAAAALSTAQQQNAVLGGSTTPLQQRSPSLTAARIVGSLTSAQSTVPNDSFALEPRPHTYNTVNDMDDHKLNTMRFGDSAIVDLVLSNFGTSVFVAYKNGEVKVVDLCVGCVVHKFTTPVHTELTSIDLSSNGAFLLCSYRNNSIRLWDVVAGNMLPVRLTGHHSSSIAFMRAKFAFKDTTIISGSESGEVVMWDVTSATNGVAVLSDVEGHGTIPKTVPLGGFKTSAANGGSGGGGATSSIEQNVGGSTLLEGTGGNAVSGAAGPHSSRHTDGSSSLLRTITSVPMLQPTGKTLIHDGVVHDVKYSNDHGGFLVSCSGDGSVVVCRHFGKQHHVEVQ